MMIFKKVVVNVVTVQPDGDIHTSAIATSIVDKKIME